MDVAFEQEELLKLMESATSRRTRADGGDARPLTPQEASRSPS